MINKLLHGDCLELMKGIPDGSIDAIITDLFKKNFIIPIKSVIFT